MGVILLHYIANESGALPVLSIGPETRLQPGEQDPAVNWFKAIADVRQSSADDDRHGVFKERMLDLVLEIYLLDSAVPLAG
jgi:hypothetical protein